MDEIKFLGENINVIITNPIGSMREKEVYPINYGYIIDNDKRIMTYILGVYEPLRAFTGKCIGIIKKINSDNKLIVTNNRFYTDAQIASLIEFIEKDDNYLLIRNNFINDGLMDLAENLNNCYNEEISKLKKSLNKINVNNIKDIEIIESLLDGFLNIPTVESERLYNFLCDYLDSINKESAKFYKLEYKNMWG